MVYWSYTKFAADFVWGDQRFQSAMKIGKNPAVVFVDAYPFGPVRSIVVPGCIAPFAVVGLVVSFAFVVRTCRYFGDCMGCCLNSV